MKVAMTHPTMLDVIVYSGGDLGHRAEKHRNLTRNSDTEGHYNSFFGN